MNTELNLKHIWLAIKKNIIWIVLITLLFFGGAIGLTFMQKPVYASTASFYSINVADDVNYSSSTLVSAQQMLVNDYIEITKQQRMLEEVCDDLEKEYGKTYTTAKIGSMISARQIKDTSVFTVTVSSQNKTEAKIIVNVIEQNIAEVISRTVRRENAVVTLSKGSDPVQVSPSMTKNAMIGFLMGIVGSTVAFVVASLYDKTIRTEEDIKEKFKKPVIGVVPAWKTEKNTSAE